MTIVVSIFSPIDVFEVTNMKNVCNATFMLLVAGIVFNDVASVEGKPTKRNPNGWQGWQMQQVQIESTDAVYRCHGTLSNYKEPQQCNKASRIKNTLVDLCNTADPIACRLLSYMTQAEINAYQQETADNGIKGLGD
jgi:hypothetical protein